MKKKLFTSILIMVMAISVCFGCSEKEDQTPVTEAVIPESENAADSTTLSFWGWIPYNNVVEPMTAALNKTNPDIQVEVQIMDWGAYWDKLTLDLANGEGPDVFAMNLDNYEKYKEYLEPLDELAAQTAGDDWKNLFLGNMLESTYVEKDLKIFPVDFGGQWYAYYNKTLMDELGQKVPATYEELVHYAAQTEKDTIPLIFGGKEALNCAYLYFWLANNQSPGIVAKAAKGEVRFDDAAFENAFADLQKMIDDKVLPVNSFGIDPTTDQDALFKGRKSPMVLTGAWQSGAYLAGNGLEESAIRDDEIGVMVLPIPSQDNPYVVGAIDHGWVINKNSKNKEAAMKLLVEWSTGEAAKVWLEELYGIPCAADISLDTTSLPSKEAKDSIGIIADTLNNKLAGPRSTGNAAVDNKTGEVVQAFVQGAVDVEKAVSEIQKAYESSK